MVLIRENKQKQRKTFLLDNGCYKKVWYFKDEGWIVNHVSILNKLLPNYIRSFGADKTSMWVILNPLPGVPVSTLPHTDQLIKDVYNFCLQNIKETKPYTHGDWVLSNILYNDGEMALCDWDNVNIYPKKNILIKLHSDLESGFGKRFKEIINDSTSI